MAVDNIGQALVFNGATWFLDTSAIFPDSSALPAQVHNELQARLTFYWRFSRPQS